LFCLKEFNIFSSASLNHNITQVFIINLVAKYKLKKKKQKSITGRRKLNEKRREKKVIMTILKNGNENSFYL
jgi:hypothetical protein